MRIKSKENYKKYKTFIEENGGKLLISLEEFLESSKSSTSDNTVKLKILCPNCGKEFERTFSNYSKKDRSKNCSKCSRKGSQKLSEYDLNKKINNKELHLVSDYSDYQNEKSIIFVRCICGEIFSTTYASIRNSNDIIRCAKCLSEILRDKFHYSYEYVYSVFKDKKCTLLSKEYINVNLPLEYIASCGHIETTCFRSFRYSENFLCKKCYIKSISGKNAYNWNGGYNSEREAFRKTYEYKRLIKTVLKRDNYTCQCCGKVRGKLNVHHLDGYNWCIEKRVEETNCITLCEFCHNEFHDDYGRGDNTKEQYKEWIEKEEEVHII